MRAVWPPLIVNRSCTPEDIFKRSAAALKGLAKKPPLTGFGAVADEAIPFLSALLARENKTRTWVICDDIRQQDEFAAELVQWVAAARVFPDLPAWEEDAEILADPETVSERLELISALGGKEFSGPIVIHRSQWNEEVPTPKGLSKNARVLKTGGTHDPAALAASLAASGYEACPQTAVRGQYSLRGGILDVFSWQAPRPVRVEFDDQQIESLREFDPDTQISTAEIPETRILLQKSGAQTCSLASLATPKDLLILPQSPDRSGATAVASERSESFGEEPPCVGQENGVRMFQGGFSEGCAEFFAMPFGVLGAGELVLNAVRGEQFWSQLAEWRDAGWMVVLAAGSEGEASRFSEFASEHGVDVGWMQFLPLALARGFVHPVAKLAVLSDAELFGRAAILRAMRFAGRRHRAAAVRAATDFSDFAVGDHVVHLEHGIGVFEGFVPAPEGEGEEVVAISYAGGARLYVPIAQAWQISRYAGLGRSGVELSDLGSRKWSAAKEKAVVSVFDYAGRMLRLQAERQTISGHAFGLDTHWQKEFEAAFPHKETPDQLRAIDESKRDMESPRPMDRLVCGDVGFGKTEVAVRAVFKAVMDGKQVAVLAPTTVLARQHFQTFRERMSDYPVVVELLSRYRTPAEQRKVVKGLAEGSVDVVVGTHRVVSSDVVFKDIGLVVVDEEQRFGVKQKDLLKERFRQIDVMTLSATPIPRTLYMALVGTRDMSLIETPPPNRQPVETVVCAYDERVFRDAINRELERGGQVYFLHNRVRSIEKVAARIRELCPKARVIVGHGQMHEGELEVVMSAFVSGQADVLVSTTIIESGLDIPNANTIIIDRADMFGLADLYQLRGRVGRAGAKAYAYLMLPRDMMGAARKRVSAIKQYSELGSGFKIAMRDLELRGAGNLLGTAQSGHIIAVGFDLYCKMLKRAVSALEGGTRFSRSECAVRIDFLVTEESAWLKAGSGAVAAFLPGSFIPEAKLRIACYRQLVEAEEMTQLDNLRASWRDRFGPIPEAVENTFLLARIGLEGSQRKISEVEVKDGKVMLMRRKEYLQVAGRFPRLTATDGVFKLRDVLHLVQGVPTP